MDMKKTPDPCPTNPPRLLRREFLKAGAAMGALVMAGGASAVGSDLATRATAGAWKAAGMRGAVAGGGVAAVEAANAVIERGGNAADAAATMLLAMTVTDSSSFCFGGEAPIIYHDGATGKVEVIAGMGTAPKLATLEHFKKGIPRNGPETAAVPAALDAILTLLSRHGTLPF